MSFNELLRLDAAMPAGALIPIDRGHQVDEWVCDICQRVTHDPAEHRDWRHVELGVTWPGQGQVRLRLDLCSADTVTFLGPVAPLLFRAVMPEMRAAVKAEFGLD